MPADTKRLRFGAKKYVAFFMMLCRWLRHHQVAGPHCYVTLGGTELRDIRGMLFIDRNLLDPVYSYESKKKLHALAQQKAQVVGAALNPPLPIDIVRAEILKYTRLPAVANRPHVFFIDLLGPFRGEDHERDLRQAFVGNVIREGDVLLVTSYVGRNEGYPRIFDYYDGEFIALGTPQGERRETFRRHHPAFTIFRALQAAQLTDQLEVASFGSVHYYDSSPMIVYGYAVRAGQTTLPGMMLGPHLRLKEDFFS